MIAVDGQSTNIWPLLLPANNIFLPRVNFMIPNAKLNIQITLPIYLQRFNINEQQISHFPMGTLTETSSFHQGIASTSRRVEKSR